MRVFNSSMKIVSTWYQVSLHADMITFQNVVFLIVNLPLKQVGIYQHNSFSLAFQNVLNLVFYVRR
jgi:hypothetical protein